MRVLLVLVLGGGYAFSQTPFTLQQVSQRFDSAGNLVSESRFLLARNRAGSIVSVDLDPGAGRIRQIIDVAAGRTVLVDPNTKSVSVTPYRVARAETPAACEQRFHSIIGAVVSVDTSQRNIFGVPVERVLVGLTGGVSMEVLLAPSLQCQMLQSTTSRNGQIVERTAAESLQTGDPDSALFTEQ